VGRKDGVKTGDSATEMLRGEMPVPQRHRERVVPEEVFDLLQGGAALNCP